MIDAERDPADSLVQRELEPVVLARLAAELGGLTLVQGKALPVGQGRKVQPDGWFERVDLPPLAVEVYVSLDKPKSAQQSKLCKDLLKLALLTREHPERPEGMIVVTSEAARIWLAAGWVGQALRSFGVTVRVVDLTAEERERLAAARAGQARGNVVKG